MLKGTAPVVAAKIGFQHHTQGMVANKRCGTSEAIGLAARQKYRPIMTTPHPRDPRIRLRTKAAVIERVLFYGGFTSDTGYQTPAD
jgi:hypothetical protein